MPCAFNRVSPARYILAQTDGKFYQFLVIARMRSERNLVFGDAQICVDKARLQRYNERIRNDKPLYYKRGGQICRGISDWSLPLLCVRRYNR